MWTVLAAKTDPRRRPSTRGGAGAIVAVMDEGTSACTVVGAGVSGLTSAVRLREAGWDAHIVARDMPHDTVSVVAAAVWTTTDAEPPARSRRWAIRSREVFAGLADDAATGVVPLLQTELERRDPEPSWWEKTPWVTRLPVDEVPEGYAVGWRIDGFMVEPPIYLEWLMARFHTLGGTIVRRDVASLHDLGAVVVNCSGLGAGGLAGDDYVQPVRGQVVAVANPGIRNAVADESDQDRIAYVYPRSTEVILGGVRQPGRSDLDPDDEETTRILADCRTLDPRIAGCDIQQVRVGLRPGRSEVRVARERLPSGVTVLHNYGHGGSGYILSWGCAEDVVRLLTEV